MLKIVISDLKSSELSFDPYVIGGLEEADAAIIISRMGIDDQVIPDF